MFSVSNTLYLIEVNELVLSSDYQIPSSCPPSPLPLPPSPTPLTSGILSMIKSGSTLANCSPRALRPLSPPIRPARLSVLSPCRVSLQAQRQRQKAGSRHSLRKQHDTALCLLEKSTLTLACPSPSKKNVELRESVLESVTLPESGMERLLSTTYHRFIVSLMT